MTLYPVKLRYKKTVVDVKPYFFYVFPISNLKFILDVGKSRAHRAFLKLYRLILFQFGRPGRGRCRKMAWLKTRDFIHHTPISCRKKPREEDVVAKKGFSRLGKR